MKKLTFLFAILIAISFYAVDSNAQTSRNLGVPYPNTSDAMEKEVNKLVAIADTASDCGDAKSYVRQIQYIVNSGGSVALATAKTHVEKANNAIAELDKSLGGCSAQSFEAQSKLNFTKKNAGFWND